MISTSQRLPDRDLQIIVAAEQVIMLLGGYCEAGNRLLLSTDQLRKALWRGGLSTRVTGLQLAAIAERLWSEESKTALGMPPRAAGLL